MKTIILSLNSVIDKHYYFDRFELNRENFVEKTEIYAAGKGVNIAKALSVFEADFELVTLLGIDNYLLFNDLLSECCLSSHCVLTKGKIRENISIHSSEISETRICSNNFVADDEACVETINKAYELSSEGDIIILSGRLPIGVSKNVIVEHLVEFQTKNVKFILDSSSLDIDDIKKLKPFLIKPNEDEIKHFGIEENESIKRLIDADVENIALSKGSEGIFLFSKNEKINVVPPLISTVSTVGAGDSTVAGFAYAFMNNLSMKEAVSTAVAFGTACCLTEGGKPPCKSDVNEIFKQNTFV